MNIKGNERVIFMHGCLRKNIACEIHFWNIVIKFS
jgi:hypothetical protein